MTQRDRWIALGILVWGLTLANVVTIVLVVIS